MEKNCKVPKLYGLNEVSRILGIPKGTLYNMKWRGLLPCIKIGKHIRMTEEHMMQVINMGGKLYGN